MSAVRMRKIEGRPAHRVRRMNRPTAFAVVAMVVAMLSASARACDTPVYRYAMYRWTPMSYEAFYFHRGPTPKAEQELHRSVDEPSKDGVAANLSITAVDLDRKDALDALPEPVKKRWQSDSSKPLPRYLIFAPWGSEVFAGPLDAAAFRPIVQSPLRTEIGKLFDQGHGVVLLILGGDQAEENARMEAAARAVIGKATAGELFAEPESGAGAAKPADPPANAAPGGSAEDNQPDPRRAALRIGLVKLYRSNPAEPWLFKILTAMTPDSQKEPKQKQNTRHEPMLFAIYGRGRVMPPGIGKEVTAESLTELLRFLADRCSCTVKDQNPGLDLLMRWDWEATAEKFLALDQSMAQPPLYAEVSADGGSMAASKAAGGPVSAQSASPDPAKTAKTATPPSAAPGKAPAEPAAPKVTELPKPMPAGVEEPAPEAFAVRQRWQLGVGLVGVAIVVIAVGLVLVRRQRNDSP